MAQVAPGSNVFARNDDVASSPKARRVTFHPHGSYRGRAGTDTRVKARRIGQRPFAFRDR